QRLKRRNRKFGILRWVDAWILFELVGGEKEKDQLAGDVGHRHLAEPAGFLAVAVRDASLVAGTNDVDRGDERRVVPTRFRHRLLARLAQHECAASRIAVEEHSLHAATV